MFLSPRRESKPRPFDLRWDALTIEPYQDEAVYYSPQPFDLWSDALTIEPYQDEAVYYSPPTFRSLVRRSNHWAVPGRSSILLSPNLSISGQTL